MNIIVKKYGAPFCCCRPDTSWEKENKGIWLPEFAEELSYSPVIFTRIVKAGKCVGRKFVSRYYEGFNFGVLLYVSGRFNGKATVSDCIDHTTLLPHPLYNTLVAESGENKFELRKDYAVIYSVKSSKDLLDKIEEAVCTASQGISLRIGDYIAIELKDREILATEKSGDKPEYSEKCITSPTERSFRLTAQFCENETMDYIINF